MWDPSDLTIQGRSHLSAVLPHSQLAFSKAFFPVLEGAPLQVSAHHVEICKALDAIVAGEIKRLIITMPPGYTKTVLAVILFVARCLAFNPRSRFIFTSYSDKLVLDHSSRVKQIVESEHYQALWQMALRDDTSAKGLWRTDHDGGLSASPAGGAITGFRAGRMEAGFNGALIIDDPLKPDDAHTEVREKINARHRNTFASRLATEDVPIIVIMQRIHVRDYAGNLLGGGSGERWHHLDLPVRIDRAAEYPATYTHGTPLKHNLPDGPLWEAKHNEAQIKVLESDPYTFSAQYMQRPTNMGGNVFKEEWLKYYDGEDELPILEYRKIYGDTAQKTKEKSDFSVFQEWGYANGQCYLLDQIRGKFEAPELETAALAFWRKALGRDQRRFGVCRGLAIEDKSSGTGLIQKLERGGGSGVLAGSSNGVATGPPIYPIQRSKDKYTRSLDVVGYFAAGSVWHPKQEKFMVEYTSELLSFPSGAHDDQVDPTIDAVGDLLVNVSFTGVA